MSIESEEQAMKHLYDQLSRTEYKPSAHWTTARTFTNAYQKINTDFVLDTTLVPPKGIEPLFPRS